MGLAATQVRFLNLTARKTNIEFEAQQINQQRTTLSNSSANYYNQMLTLQVPVPPSEATFSKVVYTFKKNGTTCTINQVTGNDNDATLIYTYSYMNNYNMNPTNPRMIDFDGTTYKYNNDVLTRLDNTDPNVFTPQVREDILSGLELDINDPTQVYVLNVGSESNPSYEYYKTSQLPTTGSQNVTGYVAGSVEVYEQDALSGAKITRDANNRIIAIFHNNLSATDNVNVTTSTIKDEVAYNDAYAEYQYQTFLYQQEMENINAQTSVIQAQDKKLELRLKQLDTEQNAVSTEMESLGNILDKNVEETFKLFA